MSTIAIACSEVRGKLTSEQAIALVLLQASSGSSKSGGVVKRKKGPPPDVLRKGGAHKDKKRKTGREPIRKEDLEDRNGD